MVLPGSSGRARQSSRSLAKMLQNEPVAAKFGFDFSRERTFQSLGDQPPTTRRPFPLSQTNSPGSPRPCRDARRTVDLCLGELEDLHGDIIMGISLISKRSLQPIVARLLSVPFRSVCLQTFHKLSTKFDKIVSNVHLQKCSKMYKQANKCSNTFILR